MKFWIFTFLRISDGVRYIFKNVSEKNCRLCSEKKTSENIYVCKIIYEYIKYITQK